MWVWLKEMTGVVKDPPPSGASAEEIDHERYKRDFGVPPDKTELRQSRSPPVVDEKDKERLRNALQQAYDARKFEIEMYWKRATYFWAFIASAFIGYATFLSGQHPRAFPALLMSQVGLIFSVAWHRANQGSKFWQENWENHVDLLEDAVTGPLYKTITERPLPLNQERNWVDRKVGPLKVSVSKINGLVSRYVVFLWIELSLAAGIALWSKDIHEWLDAYEYRLHVARAIVVAIMIPLNWIFIRQILRSADTYSGPHKPKIRQRKIRPTEPVTPVRGTSDSLR